jgi:hypothetical protein
MSNLRLVTENYTDGSILTAAPSFATDLENLKHQAIAKISRTGITDWAPAPYNQEISILLPSLKTISAIILGRHNFNAGMNLKFILYSQADFTDVLYDSGDLIVATGGSPSNKVAWGTFLWGAVAWGGDSSISEEFPPKFNYIHWVGADTVEGDELIETGTVNFLYDSGTDEGIGTNALIETGGSYTIPSFVGMNGVQSMKIFFNVPTGLQLDIGRLIIGDYIEPVYNLNYNHKIEWKEDSNQYRTEGYTLRSDISVPVRKMEFSLDTIHKEDRTKLVEGFRYVGLRKDFYINLFPESTSEAKEIDYSGIMKLTKEPITLEHAQNIYKSKYVMEEV